MLKLDRVDACYASFKALDGIDMTIEAGELVVLLGANGAGKTTLFNTISGLHQQGTLKLYGRLDVLQPMEYWVLKKGIENCCPNEPGTESPYLFNGHDDGLGKFFDEYQPVQILQSSGSD